MTLSLIAMAKTDPKIGPMQGLHPKANAIPINKGKNERFCNLSKLSLLGSHQLINAGLAIHLARNILKEKFVIEKTEKALMNCEWPGRLQQIKSGLLNKKIKKYIPLSKRQDRPDAILWLCKNASELTDGQISKLVGSTKGTVSLIRKRSYWNFSNLKPRDPVILALCTQEAFQKSLDKAKRRVEREKKAKIREEKKSQAASL